MVRFVPSNLTATRGKYMRKLASIRQIDQLLPIERADRIELAIVDSWKIVVGKGLNIR